MNKGRAAARARQHRHRQRHGLRCFPVTVNEFATLAALIDHGLIDEAASRDPRKVGDALARLVAKWTTAA